MDNKQLKSRLNGKLAQAGQAEAGNGIAEAKTEITALQKSAAPTLVASNGYIALNSNAIEIIGENLKNQPLSFQLFDIVKSPSGGATVFAVPGLSGEEAEKELTGVILDYTTPRAYWDTPDPVEGMAPVCFSHDSQTSTEGKACPRCEFNTFGSKNGESQAKACKESVLLFLLRPDSIIPLIVRVPVSSKVLFQKYTTRLCSALTPISSVVTRITLEKATSKDGKPYAKYIFEVAEQLGDDEAAQAKAFGQKFMELLNISEQPEILEMEAA